MTPLLLAIDVGTQSVRALAFDREGHLQARAQRMFEPPFDSPAPGEPADAGYPVTVSGSMTPTPTPVGSYVIAGNATVAEVVGSP